MMKMDSIKMKNELQKRLAHPDRKFEYDRKNDRLRIEQVKLEKELRSHCQVS